jgi:predicted enzyme related to lactoylglutathione lyase
MRAPAPTRLPPSAVAAQPHWINYVRVDDVAKMVDKAVALGGRVLVGPRLDRHGGHVAIVADPQGAVFGMLEWTTTDDQKVAK